MSDAPGCPRLFCTECGTQATPGGQFCMTCGARLHLEYLDSPPAPAPAAAGPVPPAPAPESRTERSPWRPVAAILGMILGGLLGGELGQVLCYAGAKISAKESPGATPQVAALAESQEGVRPGRMLGGLAGFLVTVLCLGRPGRIRWFSFGLGGLAGGAAGALAGFITGYL